MVSVDHRQSIPSESYRTSSQKPPVELKESPQADSESHTCSGRVASVRYDLGTEQELTTVASIRSQPTPAWRQLDGILPRMRLHGTEPARTSREETADDAQISHNKVQYRCLQVPLCAARRGKERALDTARTFGTPTKTWCPASLRARHRHRYRASRCRTRRGLRLPEIHAAACRSPTRYLRGSYPSC